MTNPVAGGTERIVVGIDGSDSSLEALRWAVHYATLTGGIVDAVIAWQYPVNLGYGGGFPASFNPEQDAQKALADSVATVLHPDGSGTLSAAVTVNQLVRDGYPAQILLDESKDAQLLVVGSRGHGGFAGLL